MDKFEFLKQWYEREDDRRTSLESSLNIPIGILTILFAMQFFILKEFDFENSSLAEKYFLIGFISLSITTSLITTFYLFKSYHNLFKGFKYTGLPFPADLIKHEKELIDYYETHKSNFKDFTGHDKFKEYLINKLIEHTDRNTRNNDKKSLYLHRSKGFILVSLVSLLLTFIPFLFNYYSKPDNHQRIEIINLEELNYPLENIKQNEKNYGRREPTTDTTTNTSNTSRGQGN